MLFSSMPVIKQAPHKTLPVVATPINAVQQLASFSSGVPRCIIFPRRGTHRPIEEKAPAPSTSGESKQRVEEAPGSVVQPSSCGNAEDIESHWIPLLAADVLRFDSGEGVQLPHPNHAVEAACAKSKKKARTEKCITATDPSQPPPPAQPKRAAEKGISQSPVSIALLHLYNELRDEAHELLGALAHLHGTSIVEMHRRFDTPSDRG